MKKSLKSTVLNNGLLSASDSCLEGFTAASDDVEGCCSILAAVLFAISLFPKSRSFNKFSRVLLEVVPASPAAGNKRS